MQYHWYDIAVFTHASSCFVYIYFSYLYEKTVGLTGILYTVRCSNENASESGLQVKFLIKCQFLS